MPLVTQGQWSNSVPSEIQLALQDESPDWDWQVRECNAETWFVARMGTKTIAGKILAESETHLFTGDSSE